MTPGPRGRGRGLLALTALAALAVLAPRGLEAQGVRGWTSTSVRFFELRPLRVDTVPRDEIVDGGIPTWQGYPVRCVEGVTCVLYRPDAEETAWVGTQDVGFTAWGFGVQGLSFTGLVRGRDHLSGDLRWPLSDDPFDVLVGYAELQRDAFRVRLGRQDTPSGLGFSGFDGGSVRWDGATLWAEAYGGRSLARGLNETRREALRGIEDFVPDQESYLWGGAAGFRYEASSLALRYQREIISDRSGLVGERAALDFGTVLPWAVRLRSSLDYDVPFDRVGKAHLNLQRAFGGGRVLAEVEARRYLPYFELSTVWGFFSPVPYHEARVRLAAGLSRGTGLRLSLAAREYDDPSTEVIFEPLEDRGYVAEADAFWMPSEAVRLEASYQLDWGNSAFFHAVDGAVAWRASPSLDVRLTGTSFQQFEAYRLGDARAVGGGASLQWQASERVRLDGGAMILRQDEGRGGPDDVWNQTRGWFGLRYAFGDDPGMRRGGLR